MKFDSFDRKEDDENNSIGFVEISTFLAAQNDFFVRNDASWLTVHVYQHHWGY